MTDRNLVEQSRVYGNMARRRRIRVLIGTVALLTGLYFAGGWWSARRLVSPAPGMPARPAGFAADSLPDGSTIWIKEPGVKPKAVFVFVHGLGGNMKHWTDAMSSLAGKGYASITVAMPGHDDSPYERVGFGPLESTVVHDAAREARTRWPGAKVVLVGVSLGGSACWLAVQRDPTCADGVVSESAFARLEPAVDGWFSRMGSLGQILFAPTRWMATRMADVDPTQVNPVVSAQIFQGPSAILHAENDKVIARSHGEELAKAVGAELQIISGCAHAQGYSSSPGRMEEAMLDVASRTEK